jgi:peroxiredoxin
MRRSAHLAVVLALAFLLLPRAALAQTDTKQPTPPATVSRPPSQQTSSSRGRPSTRVAVGEKAPDFVADNIEGKPIQLSKLRGNWVMLVFVERRDSLLTLVSMAKALKSMNVNTVAVCWDKAQSLKNYLRGRDIGLMPLADPTGEIVALYGLLNSLRDESEPGFVLINPIGDVRLALLGLDLPNADASRLVEFAVTGE